VGSEKLNGAKWYVVLLPAVCDFSATCCISMLHLCYEHDICLSVCLSVMLVDCDHTVQQMWKLAHEADPDRNVL